MPSAVPASKASRATAPTSTSTLTSTTGQARNNKYQKHVFSSPFRPLRHVSRVLLYRSTTLRLAKTTFDFSWFSELIRASENLENNDGIEFNRPLRIRLELHSSNRDAYQTVKHYSSRFLDI